MAINLTEAQVAELVAKVVKEIRSEAPADKDSWDATQYGGRKFIGVYDTMEEAIAVGDEGNDLAMVAAAGLGVAMGNATAAVKAAANIVTADCDHDGVAEVIEHYLL